MYESSDGRISAIIREAYWRTDFKTNTFFIIFPGRFGEERLAFNRDRHDLWSAND